MSNTPKLEATIRGSGFKIRVSKVMPEGKSDGETLPERKEHNLCSVSHVTHHTSHVTHDAVCMTGLDTILMLMNFIRGA